MFNKGGMSYWCSYKNVVEEDDDKYKAENSILQVYRPSTGLRIEGRIKEIEGREIRIEGRIGGVRIIHST